MKIIKDTEVPGGKRRMIIELKPGEKLLTVSPGEHYKLGYPVEDIMPAHVIAEAVPVMWCAVEQKWID